MLLPLGGIAQETVSFPAPGNDTGIFCNSATTWNGSAWSNGQPSAEKDVIFAADYNQDGDTFNACSVFVQDGANVSFNGYANAVVVHNVNVQDGSTLVFESGSNLIQIENDLNNGNVTIRRNSSKVKKDQFTLWSSPVSGTQTLLDFSPETMLNRFYTYSTVDNIYNTVVTPASATFAEAKGYLIRTPESHPETPASFEGEFTGIPTTGTVSMPMSYVNEIKGYNAVGNPYPSPISIRKFLEANADNIDGTIWLWRKTDDSGKSSYSTVTKLGFQSNTSSEDQTENDMLADPFTLSDEGILNTAQGFLVKATGSADLVFDNSMRMAISTQSFFSSNDEPAATSRYWINVTGNNSRFSQALIGYTTDGTNGYDHGFDGESILDGGVVVYTIASDKRLAIQARPEFEVSDEVTLGFKAQAAGTFEFSLDHMDGLFEDGQQIYIVDALTGEQHDLTEGDYSFTSEAGTFENRFRIIYTTTLGTEGPMAPVSDVIVFGKEKQLHVNAPVNIASIVVYDMLGRTLYQQNAIDATEISASMANQSQEVLVVNITLENGSMISKKIVMN